MSLKLNPGCALCGTINCPSQCGACKVAPYCSRDHRTADWDAHKRACKSVSAATTKLQREEASLRAMPGDFMTPAGATIFEDEAGHFWGIDETRDYMRARYALVEALRKIETKTAVQAAGDNVEDLLRLNRSDNMGVRDVLPFLYLRLGRDQDCYDFVKWWSTTEERPDYDWGNMELGFLDIKDADALEDMSIFAGISAELSSMIAVTLIKIRAMIDLKALQNLQNSNVIGDRVPQELLDIIQTDFHPLGDIISKRTDVLDTKERDERIDELEEQIWQLFTAVDNQNSYFWPAMIKPSFYSEGTEEHMQVTLQQCYRAWVETPGAIGVIEDYLNTELVSD